MDFVINIPDITWTGVVVGAVAMLIFFFLLGYITRPAPSVESLLEEDNAKLKSGE